MAILRGICVIVCVGGRVLSEYPLPSAQDLEKRKAEEGPIAESINADDQTVKAKERLKTSTKSHAEQKKAICKRARAIPASKQKESTSNGQGTRQKSRIERLIEARASENFTVNCSAELESGGEHHVSGVEVVITIDGKEVDSLYLDGISGFQGVCEGRRRYTRDKCCVEPFTFAEIRVSKCISPTSHISVCSLY